MATKAKLTKAELFTELRKGPQVIRYTKRDGTTKAAVFSLQNEYLDEDTRKATLAQRRTGPETSLRAYSVTDGGFRTINVNKVKSVDATTVV